ncbi:Mss4-like protein [Delphinella strobiligena]|nr:Mss4-like protein [Delphinella strobiligena]
MPSGSCLCGSCLCGKIGISYDKEPEMKALCHCTDCQKISGSAFSSNFVVPGEGFKVTGSPKVFTKKADSGKTIHTYFCGDCGSTLYRDGDNFPGMKIVKAGVLDGGALDAAGPWVLSCLHLKE